MGNLITKIRPYYRKDLAFKFAKRRLMFLNDLSDNFLLSKHEKSINVLDVGCSKGEDFILHLSNRSDLKLFGLDLKDRGLRQDNFTMIVGDAGNIVFPDNYFDITVSIGVLEHIKPMEKLCRVISEINRVSKSFYIVVPSISTFVESHTDSILGQLKNHTKKKSYGKLIYLSDEAWLSFKDFHEAKSCRFSYIPFLMNNLFIYKNENY